MHREADAEHFRFQRPRPQEVAAETAHGLFGGDARAVRAAGRGRAHHGLAGLAHHGAHVLEVDVPSATVTAVHASSEPIHGLEAWVEAITPINERLDQGGA